MALLTFNGESYDVHHAVKGADYIHGYNADNGIVIAFDGISDFSGFSYTEEYMTPEHCAQENCNIVKHVAGKLLRADGGAVRLPTFEIGSYVGTGPENDVVITTKQKPEVVCICSQRLLIYFNPSTKYWGSSENWSEQSMPKTIVWGDNSITLVGNPSEEASASLWNRIGSTYYYIVLTK